MSRKLLLLGIKVDSVTMNDTVETVRTMIRSNERPGGYICVANVHSLMTSRRSEKLRTAFNASSLTVPDGMPLVWAGRFLGHPMKERVAGPDLMAEVLRISDREGFTHFFYGSSEAILSRLEKNIRERFPGIKIAGSLAPPFKPLTEEEDRAVVDAVNAAGPDVVWVCLGAPKQELWMAEHFGRLKAPVMIGVGAAFDFHAGNIQRAPIWMQKRGLEWAWRLYQEPGRLWKRYLIDDLPFFWYILKQKYFG